MRKYVAGSMAALVLLMAVPVAAQTPLTVHSGEQLVINPSATFPITVTESPGGQVYYISTDPATERSTVYRADGTLVGSHLAYTDPVVGGAQSVPSSVTFPNGVTVPYSGAGHPEFGLVPASVLANNDIVGPGYYTIDPLSPDMRIYDAAGDYITMDLGIHDNGNLIGADGRQLSTSTSASTTGGTSSGASTSGGWTSAGSTGISTTTGSITTSSSTSGWGGTTVSSGVSSSTSTSSGGATQVPEPEMLSLFVLAGGAAWYARRRSRRKVGGDAAAPNDATDA